MSSQPVPENKPVPPMLPHAIRRNVLPADLLAELLDWALANREHFKPAQIASKAVDKQIRANLKCDYQTFTQWRPRLIPHFKSLVPGLAEELGAREVRIDMLELELTSYNDGGFYKRHIDTFTGEWRKDQHGTRMLSAVYYFHRQPKGFSGGDLRLYQLVGNGAFVDIAPEHNMLAAFLSWSPHEVMPVACPSGAFEDTRFAINCWVRKKVEAA